MNSELDSLKLTKDFFKKIIIRNDIISSFYDENGILHANLMDFLLGKIDLLKYVNVNNKIIKMAQIIFTSYDCLSSSIMSLVL